MLQQAKRLAARWQRSHAQAEQRRERAQDFARALARDLALRGGDWVEVDLIYAEAEWSPFLSFQDANKLDDFREALRLGDLKSASSMEHGKPARELGGIEHEKCVYSDNRTRRRYPRRSMNEYLFRDNRTRWRVVLRLLARGSGSEWSRSDHRRMQTESLRGDRVDS
jgi:hypothetical protein